MEKHTGMTVKYWSFVIGLCFVMAVAGLSVFGRAEAASATGVVTAESLNVRTGPGTSYPKVKKDGKFVYLFKDDEVKIVGDENNFYKVKFSYNGSSVTGYSSKSYIKLLVATASPTAASDTEIIDEDSVPGAAITTATPQPTSTSTTKMVTGLKLGGKVTASALKVRTKSSVSSAQLTYKDKKISLKKNKSVTILRQKIVKGVVWYYVKFKYSGDVYLKGYVHSDYVQLTFSDTVRGTITTNSKVIVRNSAGVNDDYLLFDGAKVKLSDGKRVIIKKEAKANSMKWFKVSFKYKGETLKGYVLSNQVLYKKDTTTTKDTEATASPAPSVKPSQVPEATTDVAVTKSPAPQMTASPAPTQTPTVTEDPDIEGEVTVGPLNVRVAPGKDQDKLSYNGVDVKLAVGTNVTIHEITTYNNEAWYHVTFVYEEQELSGYVMAQYVAVSSAG